MESAAALTTELNKQIAIVREQVSRYLHNFKLQNKLLDITALAIEVSMQTFKITKYKKFYEGTTENEYIARAACMHLLYGHANLSFKQIGEIFGNSKRHTIRRIKKVPVMKAWNNNFSVLINKNEEAFKMKLHYEKQKNDG